MTSSYRGIARLGGPQRALDVSMPLANGLSIPCLGFGTYRLAPEKTEKAVMQAVNCGYRHIDCAPVYGNEKQVGSALRKFRDLREKMFITSKLWPTDQHPQLVEERCANSMRDLGVDVLDLYLLHWPVCWRRGLTPIDFHPSPMIVEDSVSLLDTWRAMETLVDKGFVKSIGFSNCTAAQARLIHANARIPAVNHQMEIHPGFAQSDLKNLNSSLDIITTAYCPFGMPTRFSPPTFEGVAKHPFLKPLCEQSGFSPYRLLLNWNLDQNNVVIVKSENALHIEENAKAQKYALSEAIRWTLNHFEDQVLRTRVLNPTGFQGSPSKFFAD